MQAVLAALFPVFLLIVAGFLLRRFLIAEDDHRGWCAAAPEA